MGLKVLQIISHYVPAYRFGGPLQVAHNLGKALVIAGHQVVVVTTNLADDVSILDVPIDQAVNIDGINVYYEPVQLLRYWGFSPGLWKRAAREIRKADIILVHAHFQFANWAGAYLARKIHKPYVIFAHGSLHNKGISSKHRLFKHLYLKLIENNNLNHALFIAFNAPEELNGSLYKENGLVIYSGINPGDFKTIPAKGYFRSKYPELRNKRLILFLGRLDIEQKGLDLLLPAFARLLIQKPDLHLVFAGPDENGARQILEKLARVLGVREGITFTGLIAGNDKIAALNEAEYFVMPSRFEGLSIALLEALYFGIPLLVTDQVGLSDEIAQSKSGIVVPVNEESIYLGLSELLDNSNISVKRGNGTKLILGKYAWDLIAKGFVEKIRALLDL